MTLGFVNHVPVSTPQQVNDVLEGCEWGIDSLELYLLPTGPVPALDDQRRQQQKQPQGDGELSSTEDECMMHDGNSQGASQH